LAEKRAGWGGVGTGLLLLNGSPTVAPAAAAALLICNGSFISVGAAPFLGPVSTGSHQLLSALECHS